MAREVAAGSVAGSAVAVWRVASVERRSTSNFGPGPKTARSRRPAGPERAQPPCQSARGGRGVSCGTPLPSRGTRSTRRAAAAAAQALQVAWRGLLEAGRVGRGVGGLARRDRRHALTRRWLGPTWPDLALELSARPNHTRAVSAARTTTRVTSKANSSSCKRQPKAKHAAHRPRLPPPRCRC